MPKLYEYLGLIILFYSNDHEPIHVHGKYQGTESKADIIFIDGVFKEILISDVKGKRPLDSKNLKNFKAFVEVFRDDIVAKWVDYFVYNKPIASEVITKKL
ncbi:DUF4160 domain-containing protein [Pedobacter endophyticus]|uniref:DUF4160 domain-containing protein n=1 Tax=Pedobacter endophyticus TaxID=2789740 RepID=A0A7U3Q4P7_9SPHI|nr:DUF4160 domain-containing protein [Pedobacter endophyticus]QPH38417.1 DUF4160 domain-containing protein [Pedobacter endophyticus]